MHDVLIYSAYIKDYQNWFNFFKLYDIKDSVRISYQFLIF
jgi:hypothetical protein